MIPRRPNISVFGLGRVGLITAVCFARKGYSIVGIDPDEHRLDQVRKAEPPFFEPDLAQYLKEAVSNGALTVSRDPSLVTGSDLAFITVGTPSNQDGSINCTYVQNASIAIGQSLRNTKRPYLVIIKSTVTPGTARNLVGPILERESGKISGSDFVVCSNPEFLQEGRAIHDAEYPDRIVIGSDHKEAVEILENFYREFHGEHMPAVIRTSHENAELIKYANNAFLATKIGFINTIAGIAERITHSDVRIIAEAIGLDSRIGPRFLNAGLGYGGSCFPKDLSALLALCKNLGYEPELLEGVLNVNRQQPLKAVEFAVKTLGSLQGKKIAVLGLAFKPDTDDMREAVSVPIIENLLGQGALVCAYDPVAREAAEQIFGRRIGYASNARQCLKGAELAIVVTEWKEFRELNSKDFLAWMKSPIVFDGRRIYDPRLMEQDGIVYAGVGLSK